MKAKGVDLASLFRFQPEEGRIWLKDYRMVMMSACALGALRRELIETLGMEQARGAMKRFGHAAGLADAHALAERFPDATPEQHLDFGPALHGLEGVANIVRDPEKTRIDLENGHLHVEAHWQHSYEAEQHLELFGLSDEPVCWTLAGYATGHSSSAAGDRTIVVETECKAMGHERCRFVLDYARNMPEETKREEPDYQKQHLPEVLQGLFDKVNRQELLAREGERRISNLEDELASYRVSPDFIGDSPRFEAALKTASSVAHVDATVLVLGESGTGKELLARHVHERSLRRDRAFVAVNCSALPETLQEAELFGYAKGAFTGASAPTAGVFEAAHKGTLFLDEIGDLSLTAQTKILRALQEGEVKRLGEARTRKVDVRIVAATNKDLKAMVRENTFREDLFYRLNVITVTMPPLRERGVDRFHLAAHFLERFAAQFSKPLRELSCDARAAIGAYAWPGNVRELQHAIERGVILAAGREVTLADLPEELSGLGGGPSRSSSTQTGGTTAEEDTQLANIAGEEARIRKALELSNGNRERVAAMLGWSRTTLWRRMKKYSQLEN
ncbi:MAG: sigma-54-dependent Fis family transcriptional regulator [bacterium]|nr:sigma-54-dependent Fis family transcriptional regulator [bacterium]